jgi:Peptidase family C78
MEHWVPLDVTPLLDWIKQYFDIQTEDHPTSVQERWRAATPVVISDRMPLILQHQGHSRTIIGYEIAKDGSTTLLTFDPAMYVFTPSTLVLRVVHGSIRRMTQLDIRRTALSSLCLSKQRTGHVSDSNHSSTGRLAESLKNPFQTRTKRAGPSAEGQGDSSPKRLRTDPIGDDVLATEDNEKTLDIRKVLKIFRVDQKRLA